MASEDGVVKRGQEYQKDGMVLPYTEEMVFFENLTPYLNQPFIEILPHDSKSALVRIYTVAAIQAVLDAYFSSRAVQISLPELPTELLGITVVYNSSNGSGTNSHPASQQTFQIFGSGSGSLNPKATSQGSASVVPEIIPSFKDPPRDKIPATEWEFYTLPNPTVADLITRLTALAGSAVLAEPLWKPISATLVLNGQQVSGQATADATQSLSLGSGTTFSTEWGNGTSNDSGVTVTSKTLPATIHHAITIANNSTTSTTSASATANTTLILVGGIPNPYLLPISTNTASTGTLTATASVTPTSLPATTPETIPTTGLYLVSYQPDPVNEWGRVHVVARVVDFTQFA